MGPVISVYTPSNTDPGTLKRIFVQRHRLLEKLVDRLARSMTSADKHHALLVGPRGSGKTHLVTLVEHELRGRPGLSGVMRIAWLGEDATIATLVDLAFSVAEQLARAYPDEFPADFRDPVRGLSPDDAAEATLAAVLERLGERSLVLFMENLERAFAGLGDPGRKRWRAFLQETRKIATLATSQRLFEAVSSREEAFFGFFDIHHLQALSVAEAHELMVRISAEQGKVELTEFLGTSAGRYRVRALHHLAGGNHRLYVMLSEFLTKDSLDDLVEAFDLLAEELTPYFQSRILALAPQQARVVECLCAASGAMTVKEVAEDTFIAERSCSKQLGELKGKGYVRSHRRGRESFYEVTEPLMRLCLEVKQQRGRPLRLVAQFLRAWFSAEALGELCDDTSLSPRGAAYRTQALRLHKGFDDFIAADLRREIDASLAALDFTGTAALADELRHIDPTAADHVGARLRAASGDRDKGAPRNPDAETLLAEAAAPSSEEKLPFLRNQAKALGLPSGGAIADLPKVQARFKVLELPGSGGRIAAHQCVHHGLAYDSTFTFVAFTPAERVMIGLGAVELRSNAPTIVDAAGLERLAEKKTRYDRVYGLEEAPEAATWADRFDAGEVRLV